MKHLRGGSNATPIVNRDSPSMKSLNVVYLFLWLVTAIPAAQSIGAEAEYKGLKVCSQCHFDQAEAWKKTAHAKAFESLKPNIKSEAKTKAGLDAAKDYTADVNCISCHTTGYGKRGGYQVGMTGEAALRMIGVLCEACHGAGGNYRDKHSEAIDKLKITGETSDRHLLTAAGQNFNYETACASCHLNYPGSAISDAKPPYSPFTPAVDAKYQFDYGKAVRKTGKGNPVHTHYKMRGVFKGGEVPAIRAEMQETAEDPDPDE